MQRRKKMSVLDRMPEGIVKELRAACVAVGFGVLNLTEHEIDSTCWQLGEHGEKHVSIALFSDGTWGWSIADEHDKVIDHNIA